MAPTVPIQTLKNLNPAWVRGDMGDLDTLAKSINAQGMVLPVLLYGDHIVVDGARRILAAEKLGHNAIPVQWAQNWTDVVTYYAKANAAHAEGWPHEPFTWLEIADITNRIYTPISRKTNGNNRGPKKKGRVVTPAPAHNNEFGLQVADAVGTTLKALKTYRDIASALKLCYTRDPALGKEAERLIHEGNSLNTGLYSVHAAVRMMARGHLPLELAQLCRIVPGNRGVWNMRTHTNVDLKWKPTEENKPTPPTRHRGTQETFLVNNMLQVLETVGNEVTTLAGNGGLSTAFDPHHADEALKRFVKALRSVRPLQKLLAARAGVLGESE